MATVERNGFRFDTGAIVLTRRYVQMLKLAAAAGLAADIVSASSSLAIPRNGIVHHVHADSPLKNIFTNAVSWRAKLSAVGLLRDVARSRPLTDWYDLSRSLPLDTESVFDYLSRHCSTDMRDTLIGPLYRGLYLEEMQDMSVVELLTILNNFYGAPLFTFREGIDALPRALARTLDVRLGARVVEVEQDDSRVRVTWQDAHSGEHVEEASACVIALTAPQMAGIRPQLEPELRESALSAKYSRILNVQLALARPTAERALAVMLSANECPDLYSIYLDHNKNALQMPAGRGVATIFWNHSIGHRMWGLDDDEIVARTAQAAAKVIPGIDADVLFGHVTRHDIGISIPATGDYRRLSPLAASRQNARRIHIAGDYLAGGSTNAALCSGEYAARHIQESFT